MLIQQEEGSDHGNLDNAAGRPASAAAVRLWRRSARPRQADRRCGSNPGQEALTTITMAYSARHHSVAARDGEPARIFKKYGINLILKPRQHRGGRYRRRRPGAGDRDELRILLGAAGLVCRSWRLHRRCTEAGSRAIPIPPAGDDKGERYHEVLGAGREDGRLAAIGGSLSLLLTSICRRPASTPRA